MPIPAIAYAGAYVAGQLGGIILGPAIAKKVLPSKSTPSVSQPGYFDLAKEIDHLGLYRPY